MDLNYQKTQPIRSTPKLEQAVKLARAGQKLEARDLLRHIVAIQPVNQAAWLWLSAVTPDREEAKAALAQARQINPTHHSLPRAEQWLAKRFSSQPLTRKTPVVRSPDSPTPVSAPENAHGNQSNIRGRPPALPRFWHGHADLSSLRQLGLFSSLAIGTVIFSMAIGLIILFLGVTFGLGAPVQAETTDGDEPRNEVEYLYASLDESWAQKDWDQAITIMETLAQRHPEVTRIRERLAQAHLQRGLSLRYQGFVDKALVEFERALAITPEDLNIRQELDLAKSYLAGRRHYQAGQWPEVIVALQKVYAIEPEYPDVKDLLFSAYYNHGLALRAAESLPQAMESFEAAIALRPDLAEPRQQMTEIEFALAPETPPAIPIPGVPLKDRLVLVGIAEQRMHVYEGDKKVFDFVVSTGEPGRDTAIGEFEIQNKIDVAYASTWNLDMPYWLGIYWSGPLQNGIHSLPTVRHTGYTLWDGYLGQRVSYGCVILGEEDAATLYDWAEVGAKVKIVPSLANWSPEE